MARAALISVVALLALLALPSGASAFVRDCSTRVDFNLEISSVRNMTCGAARTEMRAYRGSIRRRFYTPNRFLCYRVRGTSLSGQWRCVKGVRAFRFDFSD